MSKLGDKLRKARESIIEARDAKFIIRRPTPADMLDFRLRAAELGPRYLLRYVIGWEGVTEGHMLVGGDPHPLDFDADALAEWVSDDLALYNELIGAILEAEASAREAREAAEKN